MWIPLRYNLRNLRVRYLMTVATAAGIGLTVAVFIAVMALVEGMRNTFVSTGLNENVLVTWNGSPAETGSILMVENVARLRVLPGIAAFSAERVIYVNHSRTSGGSSNVVMRGLDGVGRRLRPQATLIAGQWFEPGKRQVTVSRTIVDRFRGLNLGETLLTGNVAWQVVGIFDAGQTAYSSEIWTDGTDIASAFQRFNYSSVLMQAPSAAAARALVDKIDGDFSLEADASIETEYFAEQTKSATPIQLIGHIVAAIMAIGSIFAGMNAMYAAVGNRQREIAVLRALGFSRRSVLASFLIEAALLSLCGAILGMIISLPLHGLATGTTNWLSFSEMTFAFRLTPGLLGRALAFALAIGIIGGVLPAFRASMVSPREAMRAL